MKPALWIATAFVLLNLFGLDRSPVVWIDEVTLNDPAKEWALHGVLRSSVFGDREGFERGYFWQPPGQVILMKGVYEVFGFGLWQTRLPPLLLASGALVALYALGLRLTGDLWAASLSMLLLALDPKFLQVARSGRMDPQCLLLALLATLCLLRARESQNESSEGMLSFLALSGLLAGLAGITHPIAVAWAAGLGLLILALFRRRLLALALFGACAAVPVLLWIGYALSAGSLDSFQAQFLVHGTGHLTEGSPLQRLGAEIARLGREYKLTPLLLLTHVLSLPVFLGLNRFERRAKLVVAVLFGTIFLFNSFVMVKNLGFYFLYPMTLLAIASGAVLASWLPRSLHDLATPRARAALAWGTLLALNLLAGGLVGRGLSIIFQWRARDYAPVARAIRETIPSGSVVLGPAEVWYAVEGAGSSLRLVGDPSPRVHDFLVLRQGQEQEAWFRGRIEKIRELGEPLPPVLGLSRGSADYTLGIWRWKPDAAAAFPAGAREIR